MLLLTKKQEAVALTLYSWFKYKKRRYGLIHREWLLAQVEKQHDVKMSIRTLDRCLARLRTLGLLFTEQRHRRDQKTGTFIPEVSIYHFCADLEAYVNKFFKFFARLFGFRDLTEYTVIDRTAANCHNNPSAAKTAEPEKSPQRPAHWTDYASLGGART